MALLVAGAPAAQEVFGYLPYWREDAVATLPWDLVDAVAHFAAFIDASGAVTDWTGWPDDPEVAALIADGAAAGRRVVLAVGLDGSAVGAFLADATARDALVDTLVPAVLDAGGRGVNIDFEFVPVEAADEFVAFMSDLADAFHGADADSHVSIASPATDWEGAIDLPALLAAIDAIFIMGYNYHYLTSDPGPVAPLAGGGDSPWSVWMNLTATVDGYLALAPEGTESKLILGLPLYGLDWPADSPEPGAGALGTAAAVIYDTWLDGVAPEAMQWDTVAATPWYAYLDGSTWHQVWCEDATSLAAKMDLAIDSGLGGFGFWALGYDGGDDAFWAEVEARRPFVEPSPPDAGAAGADAGVDAGTDAGVDASADAKMDASVDAGIDAGAHASADGSADAGIGAGIDAGRDAAADAGREVGGGGACGCNVGARGAAGGTDLASLLILALAFGARAADAETAKSVAVR